MDLEKSIPIAESAVEAEKARAAKLEPNARCLNCDTPLSDVYCPHCGQKHIARRQTLGDLLINFVSSFWSYESKFIRTGKYLLFRPGKLAIDYNDGKRERYYHPARLYVFVSFVFFLLSSVLPDADEKKELVKYTNQNSDNFQLEDFDSAIGEYATKESYDSAQRALPPEERDGFWIRKIREREVEINQRYKGKGREFNKAFTENYAGNTPKIFFLLLPVFALILKFLYVRRDYYCSEHLVFSISYYNFFFLAGSIVLLIEQVPYLKFINVALIVWMVVYLLLGMRRMYKQSWWKTILKYCTFIFIFCVFIVIALGINLAVSLMLV